MECEEDEGDSEDEGDMEEKLRDRGKEVAQISINAIAGISDYTTMKVNGLHGKRNIYVLIDSGSTNNFIDTKLAETLGSKIKEAGRAKVAVADGTKI